MARFKTLKRPAPPPIEQRKPKTVELPNRKRRPHAHMYNYRWQQSRLHFLRNNPLCRECQAAGLIVEATVVDHVVPHRGCIVLFWDVENWQPLCVKCHAAKTARGE